jgi:FkbM family methyltransferase
MTFLDILSNYPPETIEEPARQLQAEAGWIKKRFKWRQMPGRMTFPCFLIDFALRPVITSFEMGGTDSPHRMKRTFDGPENDTRRRLILAAIEVAAEDARKKGADVEIYFDGEMWIRRVGPHHFPDPEMLDTVDLRWDPWISRAKRYMRDATDHWFYLYKPQPGDVIVDIGAGRGEDAFAFSKSVGPEGRVWAIEAHPTSYRSLFKFCQLNGLANVRCLNLACADKSAELRIESLPAWESSYVRDGQASPTDFPVKGLPFDSVAEGHSIHRIDFLKMNIEGGEGRALLGCRETLKRTRFVSVATHDFRADRGEGENFRTRDFVRELLASCGFELFTRDDDPRYYVPYHVHGRRV